MTEMNELTQNGSTSSSDFLTGSLSIAPMVYDLIDHLPSMQKFAAERDTLPVVTPWVEAQVRADHADHGGEAVPIRRPPADCPVPATVEPTVDPAARELSERRLALIAAAQRRTGRRSRLRAAWTAEMSTPGGRLGDFGADTNTFVEAMRADIARAQLQSARPSLLAYLIRRCGLVRVSVTSDYGTAAAR